MAIFRVEKNDNYTVMSNYHLRDNSLTLKAKGLLSQMLSLPDEWDFTLSGLAAINKEGKDAIRAAVQELEQAGYIQRRQTHDENGNFAGNEYIIHEQPVFEEPKYDYVVTSGTHDPEPLDDQLDSPLLDFPTTEKPSTENPSPENPTEINKDISSKDKNKKKNKKEKAQKGSSEALSEKELRALIAESVQKIAAPGWSRQEMNDLYRLVVELYNPKRAVRKSHPMRTKISVNRLFGNLSKMAGSDISVMRELLDKAIANGWQSIEQPHYAKNSAPAYEQPPSRRNEEWL